ncbi:pyruvate ferredoxin oxidoreductase [Phaeacidiphilus oryzae]|uniref:pyruvate ferredoxin oxidoreductase n=1 Tax=Phaeacidiphilus oryzae TaxID=348818 RepID=UPI0006912274|nr:pyruvate ferredoxin oxidoreductase [Phaeacidiphilus oryzae]
MASRVERIEQIEGSKAVARAVAACRPQVVAAYPISPQTHIVEEVSRLVRTGELTPCQYVNVESEFAAMSMCIGASAAGSRAYTATASQGLLFMAEALFNASGLGLPIVLTVANRALGAPINIWNDHSDSLSQRDSGWIQLYARDNQQAVDLHPLAFRLAEELSLPVMVCMDGFVLTHAVERVELPGQEAVDAFLPPFRPAQLLAPEQPMTIGAMVGPEAFTEVRYLAHTRHLRALTVLPRLAEEFRAAFGRDPHAVLGEAHLEPGGTVVLAMGSVLGTLADAVDELRAEGLPVGLLGLTLYRPFPAEALRLALARAGRVVVLERALAPGVGGIVSADLAAALHGLPDPPEIRTVIAGLGGRPITKASLCRMLADATAGRLPELLFLDLERDVVERESGLLEKAPDEEGAT